VPRFPRGTAAAIRRAAAGPASAWVATSRASVVAGNGVRSPAQPAPAASRRSVTRTRQAAGAAALAATFPCGRTSARPPSSAAATRLPRRSAAAIARPAIASPPAYPTSGSAPSPAATAA
jgi:hypothetical protein